ncbi:alkyl sulfatase [Rhodococcus wratislaviensis]|uniref:Alkyl sulfatase n=1 Tax=Rhodococcus wratislaviensis TaxID=44752 RepID=A0A402C1I9_RHOWR|nr:alkyl sulfatase dimerization domain-containing protein [Rhodococcus wratislaviensis]GCE37499.1 alkyl sulfatase [Rhodococcus wratislaviensis]
MTPDFSDTTDFEDADRGFVDRLDPCTVTDSDGRTVWDMQEYAFLSGDCPETADPSLWRQSQLCAKDGLYEVTDGIYQLRGIDLSNMTIVEGETGVLVIDPLISQETAAAALALYRKNRGDRPVTGVLYTHSHIDHFGGVVGVLPDGRGDVPIFAPEGFLEHAVSENIYAGTAMGRRATYMYGPLLPKGPRGHLGAGLGTNTSTGRPGLIPPTVDITHTGQEETVDGIRILFQVTPGTEAPAEMNFLFPDHRALCMAENATHNLHNLLTLRGALVRDPRAWSRYLDQAIEMFDGGYDVAFASHHWPTWGRDRVVKFLSEQRDLYQYLHDQTLRMLNAGLTGIEIAEDFPLPPALESAWHARGYYGSVSHNVKAIYQRYMGWFDGNPTSLWQHPPESAATRYVECMGGQDEVRSKAAQYLERGDLRFAAELLKHAVFADPSDDAAKDLLARTYEQLGFGAENATWRNFYLTGALELRGGITTPPLSDLGADMLSALTIDQIFDSVALRINGPRAWDATLVAEWHFTEPEAHYRTTLSNGALIQTVAPRTAAQPDVTLTLTKMQLLALFAGRGLEGIEVTGDPSKLLALTELLDPPDNVFPIVTP